MNDTTWREAGTIEDNSRKLYDEHLYCGSPDDDRRISFFLVAVVVLDTVGGCHRASDWQDLTARRHLSRRGPFTSRMANKMAHRSPTLCGGRCFLVRLVSNIIFRPISSISSKKVLKSSLMVKFWL